MTKTQQQNENFGASHLIDSIEDTERTTLESVRRFVDTVDESFPEFVEDGTRRKIIDSAFKMVEQLVGASNQLAQSIVKVTGDAMAEQDSKVSSSAR